MNRWSTILCVFTLACGTLPALAEEHYSAANHYSVAFEAPWVAVEQHDRSSDLFVRCEAMSCGQGSLLRVGVVFNKTLEHRTLEEFFRNTNGGIATRNTRGLASVSEVRVLSEGRSHLGATAAYEVVAEITYKTGEKRIRRTFLAFSKGYVYDVSLTSPADSYVKASNNAEPILESFRLR
jgi:hypothetical protein